MTRKTVMNRNHDDISKIEGRTKTASQTVGKYDVAILVPSCDAYRDVWEPFFYCFFKYWPDCPFPIFIGSNQVPFKDIRVRAIEVGPDIDYSSNLLKMLEQINAHWIILWVDDLLLTKDVGTKKLLNIIDIASEQDISYVKLLTPEKRTSITELAIVNGKEGEFFGEISKGAKYRVSITVGLWKKETLEKLILPGETAWEIELRGTVRSNNMEEKFYGFVADFHNEKPTFKVINTIRKGVWTRQGVKHLEIELLQRYLTNRPIQTNSSYLYEKIYVWLRYYFFKVYYWIILP